MFIKPVAMFPFYAADCIERDFFRHRFPSIQLYTSKSWTRQICKAPPEDVLAMPYVFLDLSALKHPISSLDRTADYGI